MIDEIIHEIHGKIERMRAIATEGNFGGELAFVLQDAPHGIEEALDTGSYILLTDKNYGYPACATRYLQGKLGDYAADARRAGLIREYITKLEEITELAKKL